MKNKNNILYNAVGAILMIFAIVCMSIFCYGASISGDEYFSIGFANNTKDFLFLSPGAIERYGDEGWIDGEFLHDWLSVQPGEQFSIMQIHRNVREDVHPPLYFMLLNGISSFFVDQVTLFPGYLINVLSGIAICVFLYLIARKIFKNRWLAFVPSILWIASNAAGITMSYLRMYAPLCALCLICIYLHLHFINKDKPPIWLCILLGICTTIGTLTHYYFYLMLFMLFWITVVILICRKQIKKLLWYGGSLLTGEIISILAYPYVFRHLMFSERGTQVQENLGNFDASYTWNFFKQFMNTINTYVFNGRFITVLYFAVILTVVAIICILIQKKDLQTVKAESAFIENSGLQNFIIITIATAGYFLILFKISYSSRWLYMSPVFSLISLLTVGILAILASRISVKYYAYPLLLLAISVMIINNNASMRGSMNENHRVKQRHDEIVAYSENCDVIFVYEKWNNLYDNQILELMDFDQIYTMTKEDIVSADYTAIMNTRKQSSNSIALYLPTSLEDYDRVANDIGEKIGAKEMTLLREDDHAIYYIEM